MPSVHTLSHDVYRALAHETDVNSTLYTASLALADAVIAASTTGQPVTKPASVAAPRPKAKKKRTTIRPKVEDLRRYKSAALTHLATADGNVDIFWSEVFKDKALKKTMAKVVAAAVWSSRNSGSFTNDDIVNATNSTSFTVRAKDGKPVHDAYVRAITRCMYELNVTSRGYVLGTNKLRFNW